MEILELKDILKSSMDGLKSRIEKADGRINQLKEKTIEITTSEQERSTLSDTFLSMYIYVSFSQPSLYIYFLTLKHMIF